MVGVAKPWLAKGGSSLGPEHLGFHLVADFVHSGLTLKAFKIVKSVKSARARYGTWKV